MMSKILVLCALAAIALAQNAATPSTTQCTNYCNTFVAACQVTSIYPIYTDVPTCMDECMHFVLTETCSGMGDGCLAAQAENSYDCRMYHVGVANNSTANGMVHCKHATPLSARAEDGSPAIDGGPCTDTPSHATKYGLVQDLCNQIVTTCAAYFFDDLDECYSAMAFVPGADSVMGMPNYPNATNPFPIGTPSAGSNTLLCRRYHAYVAGSDPANVAVHCPHAIMGAGQCGMACDYYCDLIQGACTGQYQQFSDSASCMTACGKYATSNFTTGTGPITAGNNIACRIYHASVASTSAAAQNPHCTHAGAKSTTATCGSSAYMASASLLLVALLAFFSLN